MRWIFIPNRERIDDWAAKPGADQMQRGESAAVGLLKKGS